MPGLTFSNELISRDEGTHTVRQSAGPDTYFLDTTTLTLKLQDFACLVSPPTLLSQKHPPFSTSTKSELITTSAL